MKLKCPILLLLPFSMACHAIVNECCQTFSGTHKSDTNSNRWIHRPVVLQPFKKKLWGKGISFVLRLFYLCITVDYTPYEQLLSRRRVGSLQIKIHSLLWTPWKNHRVAIAASRRYKLNFFQDTWFRYINLVYFDFTTKTKKSKR